MKVLVTGASGMLGHAVVEKLCESHEVFSTSSGRIKHALKNFQCFDLTSSQDEYRTLFPKMYFDAIVHCAAKTDVNACEEFPDLAKELNALAVEKLIARFSSSHFIFISTEAVYALGSGRHKERAILDPATVYASTKAKAELAVEQSGLNYSILRATPVGFNKYDIRHGLVAWAYQSLRQGQVIKGFDNVFFTPISIWQLASEIQYMIKEKILGLYNLGSMDSVSKEQFLIRLFCDKLHISKNLILSAYKESSEFEFHQCMNVSHYQKTTTRDMPLVNEVIEDVAKHIGVNNDGV